MLLEACLNGARTPDEHPALPTTPAELAADVDAVVAAGAAAVHLHVKDTGGRDTLTAEPTRRTLEAVSGRGIPVGLTTGAWAEPDLRRRLAAVEAWDPCPAFASVNWHEDGAEEVAALLLDRGIGVEAGLWHEDAVRAWWDSPTRDRHLRVLLELPDRTDADVTRREADRLLDLVRSESALPVLLHGEEASTWPALDHALALGLDTRIGLEDCLHLRDGRLAPGNAALIATVVR